MDDLTTEAGPLPVVVLGWAGQTRHDVLALVDGVRVRIRPRGRHLPPLWLCDAHPGDGRTACEHVAALADTPAARPGDTITEGETP